MKPTRTFSKREQQRHDTQRKQAASENQHYDEVVAKAHRLGILTCRCLDPQMLRERIGEYTHNEYAGKPDKPDYEDMW